MGDTLWTRRYGGAQHEHCYVVRELADGSFITTGKTESFGPDWNVYFIHMSPTGLLTVGTQEYLSTNTIRLFPNPSGGIFRLNLKGMNPERITIHNILGEEIFSRKNPQEELNMDLHTQQPGVYFLKCESEKGNYTAKFVIN
jgi:hypothetical protein